MWRELLIFEEFDFVYKSGQKIGIIKILMVCKKKYIMLNTKKYSKHSTIVNYCNLKELFSIEIHFQICLSYYY